MTIRPIRFLLACVLFTPVLASAESAYYVKELSGLPNLDAPLPMRPPSLRFQHRALAEAMLTRVVLDGAGEAYVYCGSGSTRSPWDPVPCPGDEHLALAAPKGADVSGTLYVAAADLKSVMKVHFKVPAAALTAAGKKSFFEGKLSYFADLQRLGAAGTSLFRHEAAEAAAALPKTAAPQATGGFQNMPATDSLEDSFELFSGGRALSESLQLDRRLMVQGGSAETVEVSTLEGITVAPIDWKPRIAGKTPERDALAALLPADHYALLAPSFSSFLQLIDESESHAAAILPHVDSRAEDYHSDDRYQKQMCLSRSDLGEVLGKMIISEVAVTGSDPYVRSGSTMAVLFATTAPELLVSYVSMRQDAALASIPGAKKMEGDIEGLHYRAVVSPDRAVSSYLFTLPQAVVVTNSLFEVNAIASAAAKKTAAFDSLDEYTYFRSVYAKKAPEETALLLVPDGAIRKWGSARWRILDSRRARAEAIMTEAAAAFVARSQDGKAKQAPKSAGLDIGEVHVSEQGVYSDKYGALGFLTPIAELPLAKATQGEADAYSRFRAGYQSNWRQFFDPIAVRFEISPEVVRVDLNVLPLITGTEYRELISLSSDKLLTATSGDPHSASIFHLTAAFNGTSPFVQGNAGMVRGLVQDVTDPLGWIGNSISLYVDKSPMWQALAQAPKSEQYLENNYHLLPVAIHLEVKDPLKLTLLLSSLRAAANQSAPGLTVWENRSYLEQPYVKVFSPMNAAPGQPERALYYLATAGALVVSLNEDTIKHSIARAKKAPDSDAEQNVIAAGGNVAISAHSDIIELMRKLGDDLEDEQVRAHVWRNLYILNELRRLYPDKDPAALYRAVWGTDLSSSISGNYVWNAEWNTMESEKLGSPAAPKAITEKYGVLGKVQKAGAGISFVNDGLRVKAEYRR